MNKRILSAALCLVMALALACTVFAASSKQGGSTIPTVQKTGSDNWGDDSIIITEIDETDVPTDTKTLVDEINDGTKSIQDIPGVDTTGKSAISPAFYVGWESSIDKHDGFTVTIKHDGITKDTQALHYSIERGVWEIVTPDSVDPDNGTATFTFTDNGYVILITNVGATSPATGAGLLG